MSALLIALLYAQTPDGGIGGLDPKDPIYASCPDAPPTEVVSKANVERLLAELTSGALEGYRVMAPQRSARLACFLEACDADRRLKAKLLDAPNGPVWWSLIAGSFAAGILFGGFVGWGVQQLK